MPLRAGIGKAAKSISRSRAAYALPIGLGVGAAINSANPVENAFEYSQEVAFRDANFDRAVLGTDLRFSDMFPLPVHDLINIFPERRFINPQIMGDAFRKRRDIEAEMNEEDYDRGYRKLPHSGNNLPYIPDTIISGSAAYDSYDPGMPTARRRKVRPQATGDMVFGMYNLRM